MTRPRTLRLLSTSRDIGRDDVGQALVLVLLVTLLLMLGLTAVISTVIGSLGMSGQFSSTNQAQLASQSGVAAGLANLRSATSYTNFPCSLNGTMTAGGTTSSYSLTVSYSANGTVLTCSGATLGGTTAPTSATLAARGTAPRGMASNAKADVTIVTSSSYSAAFGYAIFTENSVTLSGSPTIYNVGGNVANLYAGTSVTCGTGAWVQGGLTTYQPIDLTGSCVVSGDLVSTASVTIEGGATVSGNVTSYGDSITMSGTGSIGGNAVETNGTVSLGVPKGSPKISGTASASGAITISGGGTVHGSSTCTIPNCNANVSLSSQSPPATVNWPQINPAVSDWQTAGWTVVQVATGGCSTYFANFSSGAADPFMTQLSTAVAKTVIYAPTCAVTYNNAHIFQLGADVALQVQSLTLAGSNIFESTTTATRNFSILANTGSPYSTSTADVNCNNATSFVAPGTLPLGGLDVFIYTPGEVNYGNAPSMTGQILAWGGVTGTNDFKLYFSPAAALEVPGGGTPLPPTITVLDKYLP